MQCGFVVDWGRSFMSLGPSFLIIPKQLGKQAFSTLPRLKMWVPKENGGQIHRLHGNQVL